MSEFTELSRKGYEAIINDDLDAFLELADKKVEFISLTEGRSYKGHKGVREWWEAVLRSLGGLNMELEEVFDFGDHGYVKLIAKAQASDRDMPDSIWQALRIKKGKIVWWGTFQTEDEARDALGVEETAR